MNTHPPQGIARFDSAAGMVQALALCLQGQPFDSPSQSPLLDRLMPLANHLPERVRDVAYALGALGEAVPRQRAAEMRAEAIAAWIAGLFPERHYPAAFVGSSNGGIVHLAAALGCPWLPQTYLCPIRRIGLDPDDPKRALEDGLPVAEALAAGNPEVSVHHMHDPNQDRLMLHTMAYHRLKFRRLPPAYRRLLERSLTPGATLYVVECGTSWPVTRTAERCSFQFGAVGGATVEEYFTGGPRVRAYLARYGVHRERWDPPAPDGEAPEAEWGFEPALLADLEALAAGHGWRLVRLRFGDGEDMSLLAADLYRSWYRALGLEPSRLLVESFVLMAPLAALQRRLVPLWLLFNTEPSARSLRRWLDEGPAFDEIGQMLFSHGTEGVGVTPIETWRALLGRARRRGLFLGVDEARYPRDFATFVRFHRDLDRLGAEQDPPQPLAPDRFEALLRALAGRRGVQVDASDGPEGRCPAARRAPTRAD
ncbi:hypothetical protein [Benzoatithermus flavus]|uniref:Uncharacterized protein n=1 Tax=Benzoatithermus flavus TaxID=3108223 RepID=A0ABU8XK88_9PROT